jgi:hypothetical protein
MAAQPIGRLKKCHENVLHQTSDNDIDNVDATEKKVFKPLWSSSSLLCISVMETSTEDGKGKKRKAEDEEEARKRFAGAQIHDCSNDKITALDIEQYFTDQTRKPHSQLHRLPAALPDWRKM